MLIRAKFSVMAGIVASVVFATCGRASADPLTGSGTHLLLPSPSGVMPNFLAPTLTLTNSPSGFIGTWASPAAPGWIGSFTGIGPYPLSDTGNSTSTFGFTGVGAGYIPAGTFFLFGDVDRGGGGNPEVFNLRAYDPTGALITTAWLSTPVATWGLRRSDDPLAMPGWDWDGILPDTYTIDGSTVTGPNPQFTFALLSEVPIGRLEVAKNFSDYGFGLGAPTVAAEVPEPSSLLIATVTIGLFSAYRLRRRRAGSPANIASQGTVHSRC